MNCRFLACLTAIMALTFTGCLWVCRVPMPDACSEKYSDDGECTNRVWISMVESCRKKYAVGEWSDDIWWSQGTYPLIKMRVHIWQTTDIYDEARFEKASGSEKYEIKRLRWVFPFVYGLLWLTSPIDAVVDTVMLPWDLTR